MTKPTLSNLFKAYARANRALNDEEYFEALSDITVIGNASVGLAIIAALTRIQIEKPLLLPLVFVACSTSIFLALKN